jgi:hypothetical protein
MQLYPGWTTEGYFKRSGLEATISGFWRSNIIGNSGVITDTFSFDAHDVGHTAQQAANL